MSQVFISYSHQEEAEAAKVVEALRGLGYEVWRDDQLPAHRPYARVLDERLKEAKAILVLWSANALTSDWIRALPDGDEGLGGGESLRRQQAAAEDRVIELPQRGARYANRPRRRPQMGPLRAESLDGSTDAA